MNVFGNLILTSVNYFKNFLNHFILKFSCKLWTAVLDYLNLVRLNHTGLDSREVGRQGGNGHPQNFRKKNRIIVFRVCILTCIKNQKFLLRFPFDIKLLLPTLMVGNYRTDPYWSPNYETEVLLSTADPTWTEPEPDPLCVLHLQLQPFHQVSPITVYQPQKIGKFPFGPGF